MEVLRVEEKRRTRRGRVSLTQYLESQEDQDMTRLIYFTRIQGRRREGVFVCFGMEERGALQENRAIVEVAKTAAICHILWCFFGPPL